MEAAIGELESELGCTSEALRAREAEAERTGLEVATLRARLTEAAGESASLRSELAGVRERADEELRSLVVLSRQLEEMRVSARGQATRIRLRALREAAELSARLSYATGEERGGHRDRILDALEDAVDRVSGDWDTEVPPLPLRREIEASASNGRPNAAQRRRVSVDVGPFGDFSQLVRFEDAANAIGATGDISIKRFSEGRARIDVALSEPVDLLRELEERCDLEFKVRSTSDDEIILDVDDAS